MANNTQCGRGYLQPKQNNHSTPGGICIKGSGFYKTKQKRLFATGDKNKSKNAAVKS